MCVALLSQPESCHPLFLWVGRGRHTCNLFHVFDRYESASSHRINYYYRACYIACKTQMRVLWLESSPCSWNMQVASQESSALRSHTRNARSGRKTIPMTKKPQMDFPSCVRLTPLKMSRKTSHRKRPTTAQKGTRMRGRAQYCSCVGSWEPGFQDLLFARYFFPDMNGI